MFVIADAHVSNQKEYDEFVNLIQKLSEVNKVILLGDILDFTKISINKLDYNVNDFATENIIYVKGNHDIIVDELDIPCCDRYVSDNGIIFEHGHRFEAVLDSNLFVTPDEYYGLFRRLCYSKSSTHKLSWLFWNVYCKIKLNRKTGRYQMAKSILDEMSKRGNMICGHVHYEMFDSFSKSLLLDAFSETGKIYVIDENKYLDEGSYDFVVYNGDVDEVFRVLHRHKK